MMQPTYAILHQPDQEEISTSQEFARVLESFLAPLLLVLDQVLDKRLVRTLVQCCVAIIRWIKKHLFDDQEGREKKLWEIGRGRRYLAHALLRESSSGLKLACDLWWAPVRHPKSPQQLSVVKALLRLKCHRTGKRCQEALVPLYRLRWALSRLWDDCRPILGSVLPPNLETLQALALLRC
jgi:hypothetical protein